MTDFETREAELRAIREESREVDFVASTEKRDSYDSVVVSNWDLTRFAKNPVVLFAHQSRELPIGTAINTRVEKKQLLTTVRFAGADVNPRAEQVWQGVKQGFIRGMSVGFYPRTVRYEKHDDVDVLVLDDNELLELTVTPVPANDEALAKLRQRAVAEASRTPTKTPATDSPSPQKPATERGVQEHPMTDAEIAALKTKNDTAEAQARAATADLSEVRKQLETERAAKSAAERDLAAERSAHDAEKTAHAATKKTLSDERDAALVREVDALVGDKMTPAERDDELEAARANVDNFRKRMAKRPALRMTDGKSVLDKDTESHNRAPATEGGTDKLFADFNKSLGSPS